MVTRWPNSLSRIPHIITGSWLSSSYVCVQKYCNLNCNFFDQWSNGPRRKIPEHFQSTLSRTSWSGRICGEGQGVLFWLTSDLISWPLAGYLLDSGIAIVPITFHIEGGTGDARVWQGDIRGCHQCRKWSYDHYCPKPHICKLVQTICKANYCAKHQICTLL